MQSFWPKARAAARLAAERLGDGVAARLGWRDADAAADALAHDLATEMAALLHDHRPVPPGTGQPGDGPGAQRARRHRRRAHRVAQPTGSPIVPGPPIVPGSQASSR